MTHETIDYRGFEIKIQQDQCAENPWQNWDGMTPLMACSGRGDVSTYDSGDGIASFFDHVSDSWISRHWRKIAAILNVSESDCDSDCQSERDAYDASLGCVRKCYFEGILEGLAPSYYTGARDYLDALESLYTLAGIAALSTYASGYSQGDYTTILLVATPAHLARCGIKTATIDSLESDASLFAAWSFGDVFGFSIEDKSGEYIDSCWGFYGSNHQKSGIFEQAESAIDWHITAQRKQRVSRLKTLIRNRVPLAMRGDQLAQFA